MECNICYSAVKDTNKVSCPKCPGYSCKKCFQEYLLNSPITPTCMHCRNTLTGDYVMDNTSATWRLSKYKSYKENLLYDMERARFPETMPNVEAYSNAKAIYTPAINEQPTVHSAKRRCTNQLEAIAMSHILDLAKDDANVILPWNASLGKLYQSVSLVERNSKRVEISKELKQLKKRNRELNEIIRLYARTVISFGRIYESTTEYGKKEKKVYIKACITSGCNGFLNEDFCCGLCSIAVCKACHEPNRDGHECNPDIVASVKAVQLEARPCPTCATQISKIDGCDQMWCTQCKTTFSWRTGLVERGHTHNPHYYDWVRRNGNLARAPGDIVGDQGCGLPSLTQLLEAWPLVAEEKLSYSKLRAETPYKVAIEDKLISDECFSLYALELYFEQLRHIEWNNGGIIAAPDNYELRVQFLAKEITIDTFKTTIQRNDKAYQKAVAKRQITDMVHAASSDILRSCASKLLTYSETKTQIDGLFDYANVALDRIQKGFHCVVVNYVTLPYDQKRLHLTYWYGPEIRLRSGRGDIMRYL